MVFNSSVVWMMKWKALDTEVWVMVTDATAHLPAAPLAALNAPFMAETTWKKIMRCEEQVVVITNNQQ